MIFSKRHVASLRRGCNKISSCLRAAALEADSRAHPLLFATRVRSYLPINRLRQAPGLAVVRARAAEERASVAAMATVGKACPCCGTFIQKNEGCKCVLKVPKYTVRVYEWHGRLYSRPRALSRFTLLLDQQEGPNTLAFCWHACARWPRYMTCGTSAHGRLADSLRNGGCGAAFDWESLAVVDDPCGWGRAQAAARCLLTPLSRTAAHGRKKSRGVLQGAYMHGSLVIQLQEQSPAKLN